MVMMTIETVRLHHLEMPLKKPFSTHLQHVTTRESLVLEMVDQNGKVGLGECVAFSSPWYTEETIETCKTALISWMIPTILGKSFEHPEQMMSELSSIKGNHMAKSAIDLACWDLYAKIHVQPLWKMIGGIRNTIQAGVVLTGAIDELMVQQIEKAISTGYQRVKLKIDEETDPSDVQTLVEKFPKILFYADANGIFYKLGKEHLQRFDIAKLTLIEQPFRDDDWILHQEATQSMQTPIALDESIRSVSDVERMVEMKSGNVIVLKCGRVGGITETLKIHALAARYELPMWIGGMIELGVSKAHNCALATLPQMTLPGDFSESNHYWEEDVVEPAISIFEGYIHLSDKPGIGVTINRHALQRFCKDSQTFVS